MVSKICCSAVAIEVVISIIDVLAILTESVDANAYCCKLKQRLKAEGNETVTNCHDLKVLAIENIKDRN